MTVADPYLYVRALGPADVASAAALLGRGMADNPVHVAAYRGSLEERERHHRRIMQTHLASAALQMEGVERGNDLVGFAAWAPSGHCRPTLTVRTRVLASAVGCGPAAMRRLVAWRAAWERRDLDEPHVHLGPVSVDRGMRRQGVGGLLMLRHAASLDAIGAVGYLETDRPEAVPFYRRFGYAVVEEEKVLGVRCWFMRRPAA